MTSEEQKALLEEVYDVLEDKSTYTPMDRDINEQLSDQPVGRGWQPECDLIDAVALRITLAYVEEMLGKLNGKLQDSATRQLAIVQMAIWSSELIKVRIHARWPDPNKADESQHALSKTG